MRDSELERLDLLAQIDDLTARLRTWSERDGVWKPCGRAHALVRRALERAQGMRDRLASPLVVGMFGGTGTGKSTLVNALVGEEISEAGRQRPTTRRPVLIAHRDLETARLGFETSGYEMRRFDDDTLRDIVLIDSPDPDTSESGAAGGNLAVLRSVVPHCDVLIFTATQQKYRSARVISEMAQAAPGCRLLFVQTHSDRDDDIRTDWQRHLSEFEVPSMFLVDSVAALAARRDGRPAGGEFERLLEVLRSELDATAQTSVRRANVLDLVGRTLVRAQGIFDQSRPAVSALEAEMARERTRITQEMSQSLSAELLSSQHLWERRILTAVAECWGISPFSTLLRVYNGLGGLLASLTLYRSRSAAHVALVGAAEGARRLRAWSEEREATSRSVRLESGALSDSELRAARVVIAGYAAEAGLESHNDQADLDQMRSVAAKIEQDFLGSARGHIEEIIREIAQRNSRARVRIVYEFLFGGYLAFVLWRIGKNFFWDSFLRSAWFPEAEAVSMLPMEFYVSAGVIFVLWSGLLIAAYTRRLRRGLSRRIRGMSERLSARHLQGGLFPRYEADCRWIDEHLRELHELTLAARLAGADATAQGHLGRLRISAESATD